MEGKGTPSIQKSTQKRTAPKSNRWAKISKKDLEWINKIIEKLYPIDSFKTLEDYQEFRYYINKTFSTFSYRKCKTIAYYLQGYKQREIADIFHVTQPAISVMIPKKFKK